MATMFNLLSYFLNHQFTNSIVINSTIAISVVISVEISVVISVEISVNISWSITNLLSIFVKPSLRTK